MACISILHGHRVLGTMDKLDHTKVQYCEISKYQGQREHHTSFERERKKQVSHKDQVSKYYQTSSQPSPKSYEN